MFNLVIERHVSETVAVVGEKDIVAFQVLFDCLETLSDIGGGTSVSESDVPIVDIAIEKLKVLASFPQDEIVRKTFIVVQKIILDKVGSVTQAENEVIVPVMGVLLHNMPEDRSVSDVYHRLGNGLRKFTQPHSLPATKQNYFHRSSP